MAYITVSLFVPMDTDREILWRCSYVQLAGNTRRGEDFQIIDDQKVPKPETVRTPLDAGYHRSSHDLTNKHGVVIVNTELRKCEPLTRLLPLRSSTPGTTNAIRRCVRLQLHR